LPRREHLGLFEPRLRELELCLQTIERGLILSRVDLVEHVAFLDRAIRFDRHLDDLAGDVRRHRNRVGKREHDTARRTPLHGNEEAEQKKQHVGDDGEPRPWGVRHLARFREDG